MKKTLLVIRHEIITTLTRRSFQLSAFGIPLVSALIFGIVSLLNRSAPQAVGNILGSNQPGTQPQEGYVDQSGIISTASADEKDNGLISFPDEATAGAALQSGEISAYYIVPQDYLATGQVIYVRPDFNPLSAFDRADQMRALLHTSLVGGNKELVALIEQPMNLQVTVLKPMTERDRDNPLTFFIPYGVSMVYYIAILMSASFLLSSVTKEKENRVLEILMSSVSPRQLLAGKIIGLGLIGLLQNLLWVGMGYGLLRLSGRTFDIPAAFQLPPAVLAWGVVFFLLGYAVYASLMAAVGALVPNLREASQATIVVIAPMFIPLFFISILIESPDGLLATALSLVPLTAPVTMMLRLAATSVPLWQVTLSAVLLAITAFWIIRTVAGLFRAQTLLAGQPFSLRRLADVILTGE